MPPKSNKFDISVTSASAAAKMTNISIKNIINMEAKADSLTMVTDVPGEIDEERMQDICHKKAQKNS